MALLSELLALDPLLLPLALPRKVDVISDQALVAQVTKKYPGDAKAGVAPIPIAAGSRWVVPAEILMELARASAPPGIPPGLRDLALQWAWIRYFWAFADGPPGSDLTMSDVAMAQARHHKVIASEQLGIGFAIRITRAVLEAVYPGCTTEVHDADVVIDGGPPATWGLGPIQKGLRPDYFVEVLQPSPGAGDPPSALHLLECKGTFSNHHLDQLRKGLRQVISVSDEHGNSLPGFVCSSAFDDQAPIKVRILDPGDDPEFVEPSDPGLGEASFQGSAERVRIGDERALRRELAELRRASLLSFAGEYERARESVPARVSRNLDSRWMRRQSGRDFRYEEGQTVRRERQVLGRPTRGVSAQLNLMNGRRLTIATEVDAALIETAGGEEGGLEYARQRFGDQLRTSEAVARTERSELDQEWVPSVETESEGHLRVISPGGEIIEFSLS